MISWINNSLKLRIEEDMNHRTIAEKMKWRNISRVLCNQRIPIKLMGKFYNFAIRPAMLYGS